MAAAADATISGVISGLGSLSKVTAGTLTLSGANSYSAGTSLLAGTLALGDAAALGTGLVTLGDATLRADLDASLANDLRINLGAGATIAAATGTTLTLTGALTPAGSSTLSFGAAGLAGNIIAGFNTVDVADAASAALVIAAGTVTAGGFAFNALIASAAGTTIRAGATLDLNGQMSSIANLQGAGTLTNTNLVRIGAGSFAGAITGAGGSLEKFGAGTLTLTGTNTYTGTTEISGGTLRIGDGGSTGTLGGGAVINDGALVFNRADAVTVANVISGSGSVTQMGGVLTLASANSYTGGTAITAGTITLGNIGALGSGAVSISNGALVSQVTGSLANAIGLTDGATAMIGAATGQTLTLTGGLSLRPGSTLTIGSATETGTVVASLAASDFFSPATLALNVAGGTLRAGNLVLNQLTQGAASVTIAAGATLDFGGFIGTIGNLQGAGTLTGTAPTQISAGQFAGVIAGTGGFDKVGAGTLTLTGANTYAGVTTISQGTLRIGPGGQLSGGGVTNNAALVFARDDVVTLGNAISGSGTLTQAGAGTLILTGANTHTGLTTINAGGTLQIGNGGGSGQISAGAVLNNGALVVNRGDAVTLGNAISGTGSLTQAGPGTLILTGDNSYTGGTTIQAGSTLQVGAGGSTGSLGSGPVNVAGALSFNRSDRYVQSGDISGEGSLRVRSGELVLTGDNALDRVTIDAGAALRIGDGGRAGYLGSNDGGAPPSLFVTNGGTLIYNRSDSTFFSGSVEGPGALRVASGSMTLLLDSRFGAGVTIATGAELVVSGLGRGGGPARLFADVANEGVLRFARQSNSFTTQSGLVSGSGSVVVSGMVYWEAAGTHTGGTTITEFGLLRLGRGGTSGSVSGDVLNRGTLFFDRSDPVTFGGVISGTGQIRIAGDVTLTGANSYAGSTEIGAGATLRIGDGGGSATVGAGAIVNDGSLILNRSGILTVPGAISGSGQLVQVGGGTTILTGANSYSGTTTISAGILQIGNGGAPGSLGTGAVVNNAQLVFNTSGGMTVANAISGTGNLTLMGGGILGLTGANTYSGTTTIAAGTLQIGNNGTSGTLGTGDVVNNGRLLFNRQDSVTFAGAISGTGRLIQGSSGGGTTTLTGQLSYTGPTEVVAGTLAFTNNSLFATQRTSVIIQTGGTLDLSGITGGVTSNIGSLRAFGRLNLPSGTAEAPGQLKVASGSEESFVVGPISGATGRLVVSGGTLALGADNTYRGGTVLQDGATLQLGLGGTTGSIQPGLTMIGFGNTLAFNRSDTVTSDIALDGFNNLTQKGPGTLILTGNSLHLGTTTISAGTLQIGNGGTDGSLGPLTAIVNNGTLAFNLSGIAGAGNSISGTGNLVQMGPGTLILTGTNSYSGTTTIAAGTLQIGALTPSGSLGSGAVINDGTLVFERIDAVTFANAMSGTGALRLNFGTVTATGALDHTGGTTIGAGARLNIGNGGTTGSLAGNVVNNGTLAFARSDTVTFAGVISGPGGLQQNGTGNLILAGANTYTGPTIVNAGTLSVNGSIAGSSGVIVNGGALGGTGQIPGLMVAAGGSLSPGNSIGTISIAGNLTLSAGSTTVIEVEGARADRIQVAGLATLGGALRLVPLGGPYVFNAPYVLIRAGAVTGQFATVSTEGSFGAGVTTRVTSTADAVELQLTPAPLASAPTLSGGTANQRAVARGLDAAVASGADVSALFPLYNLAAGAMPRGLDQLSGQVHTSGTRAAIETSAQLLGLLLDPWRAEGEAAGRMRVWASGFGGGGRRGGDGGTGSNAVTGGGGGVAAGAEIRLAAGLSAGFAMAGAGTQMSLAGGLGRAESSQVHGALYMTGARGPLRLGAALAYGGADVTTRRQAGFLGAGNLNGRYTSHGLAMRLEAGWEWAGPMGVTFTPGLAFQGGWFETPGFTERATGPLAPAALNLSGRTQAQSRIELGLRAQTPLSAQLSAFGRVAWAAYLQRDATIGARFAGLPASGFQVTGARPDAHAALLSAGLDWRLNAAWSLTGRLDAELSASTSLLGGTARLRYEF
ncbi:autotransporter-associated beta strand repeat-containing protein [Sediminicoccus sp. KRV36]|nr:autotransporter-associated beta strand repeat-containing protein [Sediminicoccus rosea]